MLKLSKQYHKSLVEEQKLTANEKIVKNAGKIDPKKHLEQKVEQTMAENIDQILGSMLDTIVF